MAMPRYRCLRLVYRAVPNDEDWLQAVPSAMNSPEDGPKMEVDDARDILEWLDTRSTA